MPTSLKFDQWSMQLHTHEDKTNIFSNIKFEYQSWTAFKWSITITCELNMTALSDKLQNDSWCVLIENYGAFCQKYGNISIKLRLEFNLSSFIFWYYGNRNICYLNNSSMFGKWLKKAPMSFFLIADQTP